MKLQPGKLYITKNSPTYYAMWENRAVNYVGPLPDNTVLFYIGRIRFKNDPDKEVYMKFLRVENIIYIHCNWKSGLVIYD